MSARPFTTLKTGPAGSWPYSATVGGTVSASVRHLIDLSHFFADGAPGWPDSLTSETRRHLAGCLATIETALILLARETSIGRCLAALDGPIVWPAVQRYPHILTPELLAHMRLRAAVSLLSAHAVRADGDPSTDSVQGKGCLIDDSDPAIVDAATALILAEARWSAQAGDAAPMRADLPAEHFAELVWTGAAVLATALHRAGLADQNISMTAMTDAAFALLARHNEEAGAFAQAMRLVRMLRERGQNGELLGQVLGDRHYLLFAALAGELIHVNMEAVLDILVHGSDVQLAAFCKALGGAASDYRHLLMDLRVVRGERDDPTLVRLAQDYDDLRKEDVDAHVELLRQPASLRAKLALIPAVEQS